MKHFPITPGPSLRDQLFDLGVEFPCGGEGTCGGCRFRVVSGDVPVTPEMREFFTGDELAAGWRLGCCAIARSPLLVEAGQWTPAILTDETPLEAEPRDGYGVVIDLGSTTLAGQLVNLRTGDAEAVETALNPQAAYGADIMTRIQFELEQPGVLGPLIRGVLGLMVSKLAGGRDLNEVLLCGNSAMHHLFSGIDVTPLASAPFRTTALAAVRFSARELGWDISVHEGIWFLPNLGGFVGSDILCGIIATGLHEPGARAALLDLGTNGEIVVAGGGRLLCASTAAGPAFEAGRINMGMRAGTGAIDQVTLDAGRLVCRVVGGGEARGICGSGLVDAVAAALEGGLIRPSGQLNPCGRSISLGGQVMLNQRDIRELQLAKGAVAAGLEILLQQSGRPALHRLCLAGAFGNYVRPGSARRIGLLPPDVAVEPVGNSALRGLRAVLLTPSRRHEWLEALPARVVHVELSADPAFQETFASSLRFPAAGGQ